MKEKCLSHNPLARDGTAQPQRLLRALLPSYVAVDERSMKDLLQFAEAYGGEIRFYDLEDPAGSFDWKEFYQITEDWENFSVEEFLSWLRQHQETKPHLALFLGFLYMFRVVQADLNTITQRHLDFYYREVLQLREQPAVADQVAVIFQLAKHVHRHEVKAGTLLKAGKDGTGVERLYRVEEDVVVNRAEVAEMRALLANIQTDHRLYVSPVANSADGQGAEIETEEKSWATFGQPGRAQAEIGFAVASPVLFLAEGTRVVTIKLIFKDALPFKVSHIYDEDKDASPSHAFRVAFSGEEEWIFPSVFSKPVILPEKETNEEEDTDVVEETEKEYSLSLEVTLSPDQPAVAAYNREVLSTPLNTRWPVVRLTLDPDWAEEPYLYALLKDAEVIRVELTVQVDGVRNLILQNGQGLLDPSKPFLPFGSRPFVGSNFYVGSWEVFQKDIYGLKLDFSWNELPGEGLDSYYDHSNSTYKREKADFQYQAALLNKRGWIDAGGSGELFASSASDGSSTIEAIGDSPVLKYGSNAAMAPFGRYDVRTQRGFLRLSLRNKDFGHSVFQKIYSESAILLATWKPVGDDDQPPELPSPPYTPSMQDLSLSYSSTVTISTEKGDEQFFHIHPFGASEQGLNGYLLPHITEEGQLFIGIRRLAPPQTLSLLIAVAEGSANPDSARQTVHWSYLAGNGWSSLEEGRHILHDSTKGLLQTGIIRFDIPKDASLEHTRLPAGLHWIRASVKVDPDAVCRLIDIRAQALFARFQDQGNDPDHQRQPLPAETIGKLLVSDAAVDKVIQPYASFGGKVKEARPDFYTRTSERLRHKNRAITIWDYERLILNRFPSVYKVKCVNHTRFTGKLKNYSEMAPGHVTLIIISNVQNKNAVDPLRPKASLALLAEIEDYIRAVNPPCIKVHVHNPIYEEVMVDFKVQFRSGVDAGYYRQRLEREIRSFLSPWASDCVADIRFGGRIHKSVALNFVEERSYVDYVSCFRMYHLVDGKKGSDTDEAVATTGVSILGSTDGHEIRLIGEDEEDCGCKDNEVKSAAMAPADDCGCQDNPKN